MTHPLFFNKLKEFASPMSAIIVRHQFRGATYSLKFYVHFSLVCDKFYSPTINLILSTVVHRLQIYSKFPVFSDTHEEQRRIYYVVLYLYLFSIPNYSTVLSLFVNRLPLFSQNYLQKLHIKNKPLC